MKILYKVFSLVVGNFFIFNNNILKEKDLLRMIYYCDFLKYFLALFIFIVKII